MLFGCSCQTFFIVFCLIFFVCFWNTPGKHTPNSLSQLTEDLPAQATADHEWRKPSHFLKQGGHLNVTGRWAPSETRWQRFHCDLTCPQFFEWSELAHWRQYTYIVGCDWICFFIIRSAHTKLHVIPKFIRFMPYSVACSELIGLLELHCV